MTQAAVEFCFNTKVDQTMLLGTKAKNIPELLNGIRSAPDASIYFHTHKFLQQHHYLSPEPLNDFGYWVTNILNESRLGERLSSIDIIQFDRISSLRKRFIEIIDGYLQSVYRSVDAPSGEEVYFMSAQTFVFATPYAAHDLGEFREILSKVSIHSLYYHVFDAALRREQGENDFSVWFRKMDEVSLADGVRRLDPYTYTLEGLRQKLIQLVAQYGQH